ncbi:hypothetical protein [Phytohabitans houttuyneae]|uniref:Uncharacterized protein n=1 Tax=Phytohabitans houttuyneae TaxID=1076126 RepID=A0A6V8K2P2_9ACTN|nr:hypothetical protein [Phytohabitans houttuyneae]GFJ79412.1 hypothetical protein Phou_035920 [Phytohabitans houttuyneae]
MSDLHPTPTRLALLADVRAGRVFRDTVGYSYIDGGTRVTARVAEMAAAGWAELHDTGQHRSFQLPRWRLTDVGREVLEQHELRRALAAAGFDPLPMPGTVWQDMHAVSWLPGGHRRLVKVTSVGNTVTGWQVRVTANNDVPPNAHPNWPGGAAGLIYVKHLLADYQLVEG